MSLPRPAARLAAALGLTCWLPLSAGADAATAAEPVPPCPPVLIQPVHEYFLSFNTAGESPDAAIPGFNPFRNYTHLGTDFGIVRTPDAEGSEVFGTAGCVVAQVGAAGAAGLWHSLDGLIREDGRFLDFLRPWPAEIRPEFQPRIAAVSLRLEGYGTIRVEIKDADDRVLWAATGESRTHDAHEIRWPCPPETVRRARQIAWTAGPHSSLCVGRLALELAMPDSLALDDYLLLASYAKLARCRDPETGFVRDRAHTLAGVFDGVPATAMLPLAACALMDAGFVARDDALRLFAQAKDAVLGLRRANGLLPHFVATGPDGRRDLAPGTEFSTVDTALAWHALLVAATWLDDSAAAADILAAVRAIDFDACRGPAGEIRHGFRGTDGEEPLDSWWTDWGGESALVLMLERMALGDDARAPMYGDGRVFRGCGFIAEIASLFYPWFSRSDPDAVTGTNWLAARRSLLAAQQQYFPDSLPASFAATRGIFGLSAGESKNGAGYQANGTDLDGLTLIHPHYMLMTAALDPDRPRALRGLASLVDDGLAPPWGLVENVTADHDSWLPMIGSLNAAFESLSAAHLRAANRPDSPDPIYRAAANCPPALIAARRFWPTLP